MKQRWSTYTITALALYAITANLMTVYGVVGVGDVGAGLAFASSVMSIFILIISLLEGSRQYDLSASRFHDCAREISKLYWDLRRLRAGSTEASSADDIREVTEAYEAILDRHPNHEDIDYLLTKVKKSDYFDYGFALRCWIRVWWYFQTLFLYHIAIVAPPVLFLVWLYVLRGVR